MPAVTLRGRFVDCPRARRRRQRERIFGDRVGSHL